MSGKTLEWTNAGVPNVGVGQTQEWTNAGYLLSGDPQRVAHHLIDGEVIGQNLELTLRHN